MKKLPIRIGLVAVLLATGIVSNTVSDRSRVNAATTTTTTVAQGAKVADHTYYTIISPNYSMFSGFNWGIKQSTKAVYQRTFLSTGVYHHANGSVYLSLYDRAGVWQGYVNANAATAASGEQGAWTKSSGYLTTSIAVPIYNGFTKIAASSLPAGHTYRVTGSYHWFDGTVYYSIYDKQNRWLGYVNATGLTLSDQAQGKWAPRTGFARVTQSGYVAWSSFAFAKSTKLTQNQLVKINGQYHHLNGSTYASIYTLNGRWLGYVNVAALTTVAHLEGTKLADNRYVTVTHKYDTYADLNFTKLHAAADVYHRTYHSTARYQHANGATYLALEDASGKFVGYINQNAVSVAHGTQGVWMKANAYAAFTNTASVAYADFDLTRVKTSGSALNGHVEKISGM